MWRPQLEADTGKTVLMNERTGQVIDPGRALMAPGATGGKQYQAIVINNAGSELINQIEQHKDKFGNVQAILNSAFLNTPVADPESARLAAQLASFAALQPQLHGFRGQNALNEFEKMIGGLPKNPEALVSSIQGIMKTAGVVASPGASSSAAGSKASASGGTEKKFKEAF